MKAKIIGGTYRFTYHDYGMPGSHYDYAAHSGQKVRVLRQLTNKECDPECQPMWRIVAADGWIGCANSSELRTPGKPRKSKKKMLFIVCRFWLKKTNHPSRSSAEPVQEFFTVHTTMDRAQRHCDKLTLKFGPTFIIIPAPLDP